MDGMDIAMTLPTMLPHDRAEVLAWCRGIDQGPWSSLAVPERVTYTSHSLTVQLSAAAALTERVRLWSTLIVLPAHDAVQVAKDVASVDRLSGGRLTVAVGVGGREHDYRAIGGDFSRRWQRMDDQVAEMRRIWAQEPPFEDADPVGPPPVQPGGPPFVAGVVGPKAPRTRRSMGRRGGRPLFHRHRRCRCPGRAAPEGDRRVEGRRAQRDPPLLGQPLVHAGPGCARPAGSVRLRLHAHLQRFLRPRSGTVRAGAHSGGARARPWRRRRRPAATSSFSSRRRSIPPSSIAHGTRSASDPPRPRVEGRVAGLRRSAGSRPGGRATVRRAQGRRHGGGRFVEAATDVGDLGSTERAGESHQGHDEDDGAVAPITAALIALTA